jgi:hypothetical protein
MATLPDQVKRYVKTTARHTEGFFKHLEGKIQKISGKLNDPSLSPEEREKLKADKNELNLIIHGGSNKIALHLENIGVEGNALAVADKFRGGSKDNINSIFKSIDRKRGELGVQPDNFNMDKFKQVVTRELDEYAKNASPDFNTPIVTQSQSELRAQQRNIKAALESE